MGIKCILEASGQDCHKYALRQGWGVQGRDTGSPTQAGRGPETPAGAFDLGSAHQFSSRKDNHGWKARTEGNLENQEAEAGPGSVRRSTSHMRQREIDAGALSSALRKSSGCAGPGGAERSIKTETKLLLHVSEMTLPHICTKEKGSLGIQGPRGSGRYRSILG